MTTLNPARLFAASVLACALAVSFSSSASADASVSFGNGSYTVAGGSTVYIGVHVAGVTAPTSVTIAVTGGTAVAGTDFVDPGTKTIPFSTDGVTDKGIGFGTLGNAGAGSKTAIFSVTSINGQVPSSPITATVTITNSGGTTAAIKGTTATFDCPPDPEWGSTIRAPYLYLSEGVIFQIGKPFKVSVRGIKADADLSSNDSDVTFSQKTMAGGAAGAYAFDQTVTVNGSPRTIKLRVSAGGLNQATCRTIEVKRASVNYAMTVSVDKAAFGSGEAFLVTVGGLSHDKAASTFANSPITFTRASAPWISCENPLNQGPNTSCTPDGILTCGLLAGTSDAEYLCAANMLDTTGGFRFPNKSGDVQYTVQTGNFSDVFDTYTFSGSPKAITLYQQGTHNDGGTTNYLNCASGQGVNPASPGAGCTRCLNIAPQYRSHIISCANASADSYQWIDVGPATGFDTNIPTCGADVAAGNACTVQYAACATAQHEKFQCLNPVTQGAFYHGKVVDASTGQALPGVLVQSAGVTAGYLGLACPSSTTDSSGNFKFSAADSQSVCLNPGAGAYLDYSKGGYQSDRGFLGHEYDKLIPTMSLHPVTSGPPAGTSGLYIDPKEQDQTMDLSAKNTLTITLYNGHAVKIDACYQVLHRDPDQYVPAGVLTEPSISDCAWASNWSGNDDWKPVGNDLVGTFPFSATWNIPGLVVRSSFRAHDNPSNVVSATMRFVDTSKAKSAQVSSGSGASNVINTITNTISSWWGGLMNRFTF